MTPAIIGLLIGGGVLLVLVSVALSLRMPPEYGPDELVRDPTDPTVTTIARRGLVTTPFFENGERVARAKTPPVGSP